MSPSIRTAAFAAAAAPVVFCATAAVAQQVVRPPVAQYWMDVATHTMAGMPDMAGMPGMTSMPGMPSASGPGGGGNHYGNTRAMSIGRWLDLALTVRGKPAGSEAVHAIPAGMQLGRSLPLLPVVRVPSGPGESGGVDGPVERPTGRILIYWGCGEDVRPGQPRVIDLAGDPQSFGRAFAGRYAPDRGARVGPGYVLWPNERDHPAVPQGASLAGEHAISGAGVPASMRFALGAAQDFMAPLRLGSTGPLAGSVALQWQPVPYARAYYLHAMGSVGRDMILWSSSEAPDTGMGLLDYLSNATIDRWVGEKVLLPASATRCAVPKGIFAGAGDGGAMLRMIAWGSELNLAHPPRPQDQRTPWEPEWSVRVRVKSTTMAMLGMDLDADGPARGRVARPVPMEPRDGETAPPERQTGLPGLPEAGRAIDALKGLFGR